MKKYSIEDLIIIFEKHSIKTRKEWQELFDRFKETHPNEKIPDHFLDDFHLSDALKCICDEIYALKSQLK